MKIALAQLNYHIGNFNENISKIVDKIKQAQGSQADLIVFAELAISGYPPRDFLEFDDFIKKCESGLEEIASYCENIACIVGSPGKNKNGKGKGLFNNAYFIENKTIKTIYHKSLLPNYDVFDEYRYFEPNTHFDTVDYKGKKIALTICEDLWNIDDNPLYQINPMEALAEKSPDLIINIAASPFHTKQREERIKILSANAKKYKTPIFYVNHVGAQTELLFDGGSMVVNAEGNVADELAYFNEDTKLYTLDDVLKGETYTGRQTEKSDLTGKMHDAIIMGIDNYFSKLALKRAIVGLSGGIDSAVTLVLATKALGAENVFALLLPSEFSSDHSVADAQKLAENLNVAYRKISIKDIYASFKIALKPYFQDRPFDIAEENIQSRVRAVLLMAFSNKFGYILLNTSNKSELAVGYGTLYGDMCGGISVLGDVYKTQVYEIARHINKEKEVIPHNSIIKPPSAELKPDQKDTDSLPEYDVLDKILYAYIEERKSPKEIINQGHDATLVKKILKLVNGNEYKRHQAPPVLRVSSKSFGMGRRMPIVAKYLT